MIGFDFYRSDALTWIDLLRSLQGAADRLLPAPSCLREGSAIDPSQTFSHQKLIMPVRKSSRRSVGKSKTLIFLQQH